MGKTYQKKTYRKIGNKYLLSSKTMPRFNRFEQVVEWFSYNDPMGYAYYLAMKVIKYDEERGGWCGINFGCSHRLLISERCKTGWAKNVYSKLEESEIDMMPYIYAPGSENHWSNCSGGEVVSWLRTKTELIKFIIRLAMWNGYVIKNVYGDWQGVDYVQGRIESYG
ncbi:hypothetical protein NHG32_07320 [Aerococcaceae bacterium NML191219]|nr:hypothetical protein [Aerococcaceae bacterium NML191219]